MRSSAATRPVHARATTETALRRIGQLLVGVALACCAAAGFARAELIVDITQGYFEPLPIAVPDFHALDPSTATAGTGAIAAGADPLSGADQVDRGALASSRSIHA